MYARNPRIISSICCSHLKISFMFISSSSCRNLVVPAHTRVLQVPKFKVTEFSYVFQCRCTSKKANAVFWSPCRSLDPLLTELVRSQRARGVSKFSGQKTSQGRWGLSFIWILNYRTELRGWAPWFTVRNPVPSPGGSTWTLHKSIFMLCISFLFKSLPQVFLPIPSDFSRLPLSTTPALLHLHPPKCRPRSLHYSSKHSSPRTAVV